MQNNSIPLAIETTQANPILVPDLKLQQNISKNATVLSTQKEEKEGHQINIEIKEESPNKDKIKATSNDAKVNEKQPILHKQEESKNIAKIDDNMTNNSEETTPLKTEEEKEEAKVPSPSAKGRYVEVSLKEISHGAEVAIILKEIQKANYLRCML